MAVEASLQTKIIRWLKSKGCVVVKNQAGPGMPKGFPDITFYIDGFYGMLEVKSSKRAKKQPGQEEWIKKLDSMSYAKFVDPDNWPKVQKELAEMIG